MQNNLIGVGISENIKKNSEASSQLVQAYNGTRYDNVGNDLAHKGRSLKGISQSKVNPDYKENNIRQQAGFSAELLTEAEANKQNILNNNPNRLRTADGLGKTNDQINDLYLTDAKGNILDSGHSQSKFLGYIENPEDSYKKIVNEYTSNPKYEKYMNSEISVPTDQYEQAKKFAEQERLRFLEEAKKTTDINKREELLKKAKKAEKLKNSLSDSGVTREEAVKARLNPKAYVVKKTIKDIHDNSASTAKGAMIVSGVISTGRNMYDVIKNDKSIKDASIDIAKDVAIVGGKAYAINATSMTTALIMRNSKKQVLRRLGSTSAPTTMVVAVTEITTSMRSYAKGEITSEELLIQLGEKGSASVASAYGATVGTFLLPGIGTVVGGMIGHTLSSIMYNSSLEILKESRIAYERRVEIEEISKQAISEMKKYRADLQIAFQQEKYNKDKLFNNFFIELNSFEKTQDVNKLFASIDQIGDYLGIDSQFKTFEEFDDFMSDDSSTLTL